MCTESQSVWFAGSSRCPVFLEQDAIFEPFSRCCRRRRPVSSCKWCVLIYPVRSLWPRRIPCFLFCTPAAVSSLHIIYTRFAFEMYISHYMLGIRTKNTGVDFFFPVVFVLPLRSTTEGDVFDSVFVDSAAVSDGVFSTYQVHRRKAAVHRYQCRMLSPSASHPDFFFFFPFKKSSQQHTQLETLVYPVRGSGLQL